MDFDFLPRVVWQRAFCGCSESPFNGSAVLDFSKRSDSEKVLWSVAGTYRIGVVRAATCLARGCQSGGLVSELSRGADRLARQEPLERDRVGGRGAGQRVSVEIVEAGLTVAAPPYSLPPYFCPFPPIAMRKLNASAIWGWRTFGLASRSAMVRATRRTRW